MQCIASKWTIKHCKFLTNYFFCRLISTPTLMKNLNNFSVIFDFLCYPEKDIGKDIIYKTLWVFRGQVRKITSLSPTLWLEHGSEGTVLDCFSISLFLCLVCLVWFVDNLVVAICWMCTGRGADPDWWGFGLLKPSPSKPQVAMRFAGNTVHHWIWLVQPISSDTSHST